MKKKSHNKSLRLSISKNWSNIKKKYLNHNIYSIENHLINNTLNSFFYELGFKNEQFVLKEFANKLIFIIRILPSKEFYNHKNLFYKVNWIVKSFINIKRLPIIICIKNINSPFLGAKLLNKIFNDQLKISNLRTGFKFLEVEKNIFNKLPTTTTQFSEFFFHTNLILSFIKRFKSSFSMGRCTSKNQKVNFSFTLKNKIFFQKLFLRSKNLAISSLNLRLLIFCIYLNPSYTSINLYLFN